VQDQLREKIRVEICDAGGEVRTDKGSPNEKELSDAGQVKVRGFPPHEKISQDKLRTVSCTFLLKSKKSSKTYRQVEGISRGDFRISAMMISVTRNTN